MNGPDGWGGPGGAGGGARAGRDALVVIRNPCERYGPATAVGL